MLTAMRDTNPWVDRVLGWLQWPADEAHRLVALDEAIPEPTALKIPEGREADELLQHLLVPPHAAEEIIASIPSPELQPEAWWLLERLHHAIVADGDIGQAPPWPAPVVDDSALTRYFHLFAFLAAVPHVRSLHQARDIDEQTTWDTLSDLGLQVAHHQRRHGKPGFDGAFWLWQHFRGTIYRLGRLQYNFCLAAFDPGPNAGFTIGDPVIGVHIPSFGKLDAESCDASLAQAREFFPRHFPEAQTSIGTCDSWLLDTQLAAYLPPTSNILAFQKRFTIVESSDPGNDDVMLFVFGTKATSFEGLPQTTTMERAAVKHIRDGGEWRLGHGWLALA